MRSRLILPVLLVAALACNMPTGATPSVSLPQAAPSAVEEVPVATSVVGILPAPLYFLGEDEQVWRLETDAVTLTKITSEATAVVEFDVSPLDGSLAYITANSLVRTDAMGGGRAVLVEGPPPPPTPDAQWYGAAFSDPLWSPDGTQIAYGSNGVNLYSLDTNTSTVLLPSDPYPTDLSNSPGGSIRFFRPAEWSPDGSRLLMEVSYFPEAGTLGVLNLSDGSEVDLTSPDGLVCCYNAWGRDGLSVYFANDSIGMVHAGLWRADVISGIGTTLVAGEQDGTFSLVAYPYEASDQQLYTFMAITTTYPEDYSRLAMTRSAPDGVTGRVTLRSDSYVLGGALWDPAGRGAVIVDVTAQVAAAGYPAQSSSPLLWLPSDNSLAVTLPASGSMPHWGK